MTPEYSSSPLAHIPRTDWATLDLPEAWPDRLNWRNPLTVVRLLRQTFNAKRSKVHLPEQLPIRQDLPKYILQEFHNLPNGNYSKNIAQGYARWFDRVMLGTMKHGRARVAHALRGASRVLDLGCGAGHMAATIERHNQAEVWGLGCFALFVAIRRQYAPQHSLAARLARLGI